MTKFNQTAQLFMSDLDIDITFSHQDDPDFCFEDERENLDDEERDRDAEEDGHEDDLNETLAEDPTLWMPSHIGASCLNQAGFGDMVKEEIQLRIGQANDSLEKLRTHLGHKAILYRMNFRSSTSVRTDTRSKQDIQRVSFKIARDVRSYHRARRSLSRLEASQEILQKYPLIKPNELGVNKDVTEENRIGQGSDILPWFWRIGGNQPGPADQWYDECKFYHALNFKISPEILTPKLKFVELAG